MGYLPSIATSPHILLALITVPFNYKSLADEQLSSSFVSKGKLTISSRRLREPNTG